MKRRFLKFHADFRVRTPDHATPASHMRCVKRQLKGVRNACSADEGKARAQRGDVTNHAILKRLVRGNLGATVHLGAVASSPLGHLPIFDKKHCLRINGNAPKMLTVGNQTTAARPHDLGL